VTPTILLILRIGLLALALVGIVQLIRRRLRPLPPEAAPVRAASAWERLREVGRWVAWGGLLMIALGVVTRGPVQLVLAGMAAAAAGVVLFGMARVVALLVGRSRD
jgi:hypothetical protein